MKNVNEILNSSSFLIWQLKISEASIKEEYFFNLVRISDAIDQAEKIIEKIDGEIEEIVANRQFEIREYFQYQKNEVKKIIASLSDVLWRIFEKTYKSKEDFLEMFPDENSLQIKYEKFIRRKEVNEIKQAKRRSVVYEVVYDNDRRYSGETKKRVWRSYFFNGKNI